MKPFTRPPPFGWAEFMMLHQMKKETEEERNEFLKKKAQEEEERRQWRRRVKRENPNIIFVGGRKPILANVTLSDVDRFFTLRK